MYAILVISINIYKCSLAGENFNFLGFRVGSSENSIPNELILILKAITKEICEALKGTNNSRFQLYMRGRELLGYGDKPSVTLGSSSEKGFTIKTSWEKMIHTSASNSIIDATEQMKLLDLLRSQGRGI